MSDTTAWPVVAAAPLDTSVFNVVLLFVEPSTFPADEQALSAASAEKAPTAANHLCEFIRILQSAATRPVSCLILATPVSPRSRGRRRLVEFVNGDELLFRVTNRAAKDFVIGD